MRGPKWGAPKREPTTTPIHHAIGQPDSPQSEGAPCVGIVGERPCAGRHPLPVKAPPDHRGGSAAEQASSALETKRLSSTVQQSRNDFRCGTDLKKKYMFIK